MPALMWGCSLEARVLGYMNGESVSTSSLSSGKISPSNSFRTPVSDLSCEWVISLPSARSYRPNVDLICFPANTFYSPYKGIR